MGDRGGMALRALERRGAGSNTSVAASRISPVFDSPVQIMAGAIMGAAVVGGLLPHDLQIGIAALVGLVFLPLALMNLPMAIALWVPFAYLEAWAPARFMPLGVAIVLALGWLGGLGVRRLPAQVIRRHKGTFVLLLLLTGWLTLSIGWSSNPAVSAEAVGWFLISAAMLLIVSTTLSSKADLVRVCAGFVVAGLITIAVALPQLSTDAPTSDAARLGGAVQDPNYLAAALLAAIVLGAGLIAYVRHAASRWMLVLALPVMLFGFVATGSRGGVVAAAASIVLALILVRGRAARMVALLAAIVLATFALASASPAALSRVWTFDTEGTGRVDLWQVAGRMAADHPIAGVGIANFPNESAKYVFFPGQLEEVQLVVETPKEVHNTYLQFLAETGIVGLALYLLVVGALVRITWQSARELARAGEERFSLLARAILIAQVTSLVALIFLSNGFSLPVWILLALGPPLATIATRSRSEPGPGEATR